VTGQNIANVNTPGYRRQVAVLRGVPGIGAAALDRSGNPVAPGGGVDLATIMRSHAAWLNRVSTELKAQVGRASINERTAGQLEALLGEPTDAGLEATLERFFAAFGNLAHRPDGMSARNQVTQAGTQVARRFQELTAGLDAMRQDLFDQAQDNVRAINELTKQVAALGQAIGQAQAAGASPSELLDQRDLLLEQLTALAGATVSGQEGGEVVVSIGGITVVQGHHAEELELASGDPIQVLLKRSGDPLTLPGGELKALQEWTQSGVPGYRQRIEELRNQFAEAVNAVHESASDLDGVPGQAFFLPDSGGNLTVNPALIADLRKIAAGDGSAGGGTAALAIANLGTAQGSILPSYQTLVADIGAGASEGRRYADQSRASLQQVQELQASESGVNLDEELAQMTALQHAYAASARLLSAYDEMLNTLISSV
jgi:flagellar hook-associated protein 1 FlgK